MTAPIQHQTQPEPVPDAGTAPRPALAYLRLTGASDDGTQLRLIDEEGAEHVLPVDDRLRAAVLATTTPPHPRPEEWRRRWRACSGLETSRPGSGPARRPRRSPRRRRPPSTRSWRSRRRCSPSASTSRSAPSARRYAAATVRPRGRPTLGDAVAAHLRGLNVDPDTVTWDAWRREDGRWALTGDYAVSERSGAASFTFDARGNYVTLDNEDARWLVGEVVTPAAPPRADDLQAARERRLSAVAEEQLPLGDELGDDALDLVSEQPVEAFLDASAPTDPEIEQEEAELREEATEAAAAEPEPEPQPEPQPAREEPPVRRPVKKSRGRASVPSWDEIMFGGGDRG